MAEKARNKDLNSSLLNILSGQEISPEILEETRSKRSMKESAQGTSFEHYSAIEHSIQSSELINITKSSEIDETDEIDILGCSDEDCAKIEVKFLTKVSDKGVHTTEERKEIEFGECDSIESSHEYVPQMFKAENLAVDTLLQTREPLKLKIDNRTDNKLSTDSVGVRLNVSARQLDSHHAIEQCMKDLVKTVTDDQYEDVSSDELNIVTYQTLPFENVKKPSSDMQVKSDGTNYYKNAETDNQEMKISDFSPSDELKMKQLKKALKDIDLLSSCTEEIGRMNNIFKTEVLKMLSELMVVRRSTTHVQENLSSLDNLPACTILFHDSDIHQRMVNIYEFGVSLLNDLGKLFLNLKELLLELNQYRLKFIDLSETFCVNPFELHVGESQNSVLNATFAAAMQIYKEYFENDTSWDTLHEHFVFEHQVLRRVGIEFDTYMDTLGTHYGAN